MEILIIICLLVVIVLLLQDKGFFVKKPEKRANPKITHLKGEEDIIGVPKTILRQQAPNDANQRQNHTAVGDSGNFEPEIDAEAADFKIPQEEPEDVFIEEPDYELEEEELSRHRVSDDDEGGFATGVTFEELGAVQMVLQQKEPEPSIIKQAAVTVHKIQGTELFSLLENSMEGASRRIAELLEKSLSVESASGSSIMRKENLEGFDIGDFV